MFALTLPFRLPNFCSAIRATLGQRQFRQSPGLALNAHSGNEWGKIAVLTGRRLSKTKSMASGLNPRVRPGQTVRRLWWMVFDGEGGTQKRINQDKIC